MTDILRKLQEATQDVTDKVTEGVAELLGVGSEGAAESPQRGSDEPIVSFRDVHLAFDRPILRGVSFDLFAGSTKVLDQARAHAQRHAPAQRCGSLK